MVGIVQLSLYDNATESMPSWLTDLRRISECDIWEMAMEPLKMAPHVVEVVNIKYNKPFRQLRSPKINLAVSRISTFPSLASALQKRPCLSSLVWCQQEKKNYDSLICFQHIAASIIVILGRTPLKTAYFAFLGPSSLERLS